MMKISLGILLFCALSSVHGLDNGLALTPPMGWMHWERFRCITDCVNYPNDCISEQLFRSIADQMAADGYVEAGYEYLIIDDCWLATERDSEGRLQPDPERFPNGIKALADYVHEKGIKFGIYEDYGTHTCAGYPGIYGHLETDANTFAEWEVDYVKLDGCYADTVGMEEGYAEFGAYLNQTGRPIMYSCSFPAYKGLDLIVGDYGLSYSQSLAQMTMWTVMGAPLIMSVDLRAIQPEFKDILLNKDAIRINQDQLGIPGLLVSKRENINIWTKPILPIVDEKYSYAFGFVSYREDGNPHKITITLSDFDLDNIDGYTVKNVFQPGDPINVSVTDPLEVTVDPSGAVLLELNPIP
ncbi:Melibiase domain containing protein, partial [Asbolus verrucosus]